MPHSFSKSINFRKDRAAKFPDLMRRIRSHEPFMEAGLTWVVWEGLECLADVLDVIERSGQHWTPAQALRAFGEALDAQAGQEGKNADKE